MSFGRFVAPSTIIRTSVPVKRPSHELAEGGIVSGVCEMLMVVNWRNSPHELCLSESFKIDSTFKAHAREETSTDSILTLSH